MSNEKMSKPVFPQTITPSEQNMVFPHDMTLWNYYAAHALSGLLASGPHDCEVGGLAHDAGLFADAMLAERRKRMDGDND